MSFTALITRLRQEAADKDPDYGMRLPGTKTCGDCAHFNRCSKLFAAKPDNRLCDFSPHRFYPAKENS